MRDGVHLATDLYLPPSQRALAAILIRSPYDKTGTFGFWALAAQFLNERGYAVVVQDTRGKNRSEGRPFALVHETVDAFDTIEWIVGQRWSNGVVGMFGESYVGFTQWAAKAAGHDALKAIVPRLTTTEIANDWMYHQGVFCLEVMAEWASQSWLDSNIYECQLDWSIRPLSDLIPVSVGGRRSESFDRWIGESPTSSFWTEEMAGPTSAHTGPSVPALHWGGWWDLFRRGQIRDFHRAKRTSECPQYLIMDSIDHVGNALAADGVAREDFFSSREAIERAVPALLGPAAEFFDLHLRGLGSPIPAVRWHLANEGWRTAEKWPPAGHEVRLYLANVARASLGPEGGALVADPDSVRAAVTWIHDPEDLVPSLVTDVWRPLLELPDERDVELRDDVVTFTSDVYRWPLDLAGPVRAHLLVEGGPRPAHLMAKLVDVFPTGRARRISEGACVVDQLDRGIVEVDLGDVGYRLDAGHLLRLEIASSNFPNYVWDPGTDENPWHALTGRPGKRRLWCGGEPSSYLGLRVISQTRRRE